MSLSEAEAVALWARIRPRTYPTPNRHLRGLQAAASTGRHPVTGRWWPSWRGYHPHPLGLGARAATYFTSETGRAAGKTGGRSTSPLKGRRTQFTSETARRVRTLFTAESGRAARRMVGASR